MKKSLLTLSLASTLLLGACSVNETEEKESVEQPQTEQVEQQPVNDNVSNELHQEEPQPATAYIPTHQEQTDEEIQEDINRKRDIQSSQETDKEIEWKQQYDAMNEGTEATPYVMIDGKPVDPKHLTTKEDLNESTPNE